MLAIALFTITSGSWQNADDRAQASGRERYCEAVMEKLNEVSELVEQYRKIRTL